jgi:hypothetical protein
MGHQHKTLKAWPEVLLCPLQSPAGTSIRKVLSSAFNHGFFRSLGHPCHSCLDMCLPTFSHHRLPTHIVTSRTILFVSLIAHPFGFFNRLSLFFKGSFAPNWDFLFVAHRGQEEIWKGNHLLQVSLTLCCLGNPLALTM